jgi:hypothetical protein
MSADFKSKTRNYGAVSGEATLHSNKSNKPALAKTALGRGTLNQEEAFSHQHPAFSRRNSLVLFRPTSFPARLQPSGIEKCQD